jgi:predicted  nucleic acid-binding Zn-ribbon protein
VADPNARNDSASDPIVAALRDLRAAVERVQQDLRAKDDEIRELRGVVREREARLQALSEQTIHLLDLLHEARAQSAPKPNTA